MTNEKNLSLKDLNFREIVVFVPLIVMIFWLGVASKPILSRMEPAIDKFIEDVEMHREASRHNGLPDGVEVTLPEATHETVGDAK